MSSYNLIEKVKYTQDLSDAVSLDEYIVFANERNELKYIVFKFSNNVNQKLLGMKFEVSQYDMHDHLIEKSVVIYNNFLAKANSSFVPKAKLKVLYACKYISVRLVQAAFDRVMWNEGEYIDNTYKFEHFARDEKYIEEKDRPRAAQAAPVVVNAGGNAPSRFESKNILKMNIAVFPKVFYALTSIFLILLLAVAIWLFPVYSKRFTLQGYDLEIVTGETVRICGYEGDEAEIVVPPTIGKYQVVQIGKGAFKNLPATSVSFPQSVMKIEGGAFQSMKSLKVVQCAGESITIEAKAFNQVTSLVEFDMKGARLMNNCFYGCSNLASITFANTSVAKFVDLFGESEHAATLLTFDGNYNESESFFVGVKVAS